MGLPTDHDFRKSLTMKPARSMHQLMDQIDEHKWVERDKQQGTRKAKVAPINRRDSRAKRYSHNQPRRDFSSQAWRPNPQMVSSVFKEPVHQILKKIKNKPYFKWPKQMGGDPTKRN